MQKTIEQILTIDETLDGMRLDAAAAALLPDYSRSRLKEWILAGDICLNEHQATPKTKVKTYDMIQVHATLAVEGEWQAQDIAMDIVFEDDDIIIINKSAGLVVHPGAGNPSGTLVNALLHHLPDLKHLPRAGIVHRLDKDTTGLMVVAKTVPAYHDLVKQLQARDIHRQYLALVYGKLTGGNSIEGNIGRHPKNRLKMTVVHAGKPAITHFRIKQRFAHFTLLDVTLETGRTHQIRVHLPHTHRPIVGDPLYTRLKLPGNASDTLKQALKDFTRQALHAAKLEFTHPTKNEWVSFECPLPADYQQLLEVLNHEDH